jgi:hypothetical protein
MKSNEIDWTCNTYAYSSSVGNLKGRDHSEELVVSGRIGQIVDGDME